MSYTDLTPEEAIRRAVFHINAAETAATLVAAPAELATVHAEIAQAWTRLAISMGGAPQKLWFGPPTDEQVHVVCAECMRIQEHGPHRSCQGCKCGHISHFDGTLDVPQQPSGVCPSCIADAHHDCAWADCKCTVALFHAGAESSAATDPRGCRHLHSTFDSDHKLWRCDNCNALVDPPPVKI